MTSLALTASHRSGKHHNWEFRDDRTRQQYSRPHAAEGEADRLLFLCLRDALDCDHGGNRRCPDLRCSRLLQSELFLGLYYGHAVEPADPPGGVRRASALERNACFYVSHRAGGGSSRCACGDLSQRVRHAACAGYHQACPRGACGHSDGGLRVLCTGLHYALPAKHDSPRYGRLQRAQRLDRGRHHDHPDDRKYQRGLDALGAGQPPAGGLRARRHQVSGVDAHRGAGGRIRHCKLFHPGHIPCDRRDDGGYHRSRKLPAPHPGLGPTGRCARSGSDDDRRHGGARHQ